MINRRGKSFFFSVCWGKEWEINESKIRGRKKGFILFWKFSEIGIRLRKEKCSEGEFRVPVT